MLSRQADGTTLGFTPAWVIAYVNPRQSGQIAYNIQTLFQSQLNLIDFKADRYELDNFLTKNWDRESIILNINTISGNGNLVTVTYATQLTAPAAPGIRVTISGVNPSGYNGIYEIVTCTTSVITLRSTYTATYVSGGTVTIPPHWTPQPPTLTTFDQSRELVTWINDSDVICTWADNFDTLATWTYGTPGPNGLGTIFDGGSLQFIAPVDMYSGDNSTTTNTTEFDKYLLFPKRNILQ
jgi:hypothetical protein